MTIKIIKGLLVLSVAIGLSGCVIAIGDDGHNHYGEGAVNDTTPVKVTKED